MNKPYPFSEINTALASARKIGILLPDNPEYDLVAASLALFLSLEKAGKNLSIASSLPMRVEFSHLVGLDKISNELSDQGNFTISVDYPLNNLEKVTLPDNSEKVNLVFRLKKGAPPISADKINFVQEGQLVDLFFLIGGKDFSSFEKLISFEEIQNYQTISIHRNQKTSLGKTQINDPSASSYSEIITAILVSLSLPSDQDIAQNLFLGLSKATSNFASQVVSADTFEAAALCLRAGAKIEVPKTTTMVSLPKEPKIDTESKPLPPSPDWLQPKIYRGTSLV